MKKQYFTQGCNKHSEGNFHNVYYYWLLLLLVKNNSFKVIIVLIFNESLLQLKLRHKPKFPKQKKTITVKMNQIYWIRKKIRR